MPKGPKPSSALAKMAAKRLHKNGRNDLPKQLVKGLNTLEGIEKAFHSKCQWYNAIHEATPKRFGASANVLSTLDKEACSKLAWPLLRVIIDNVPNKDRITLQLWTQVVNERVHDAVKMCAQGMRHATNGKGTLAAVDIPDVCVGAAADLLPGVCARAQEPEPPVQEPPVPESKRAATPLPLHATHVTLDDVVVKREAAIATAYAVDNGPDCLLHEAAIATAIPVDNTAGQGPDCLPAEATIKREDTPDTPPAPVPVRESKGAATPMAKAPTSSETESDDALSEDDMALGAAYRLKTNKTAVVPKQKRRKPTVAQKNRKAAVAQSKQSKDAPAANRQKKALGKQVQELQATVQALLIKLGSTQQASGS